MCDLVSRTPCLLLREEPTSEAVQLTPSESSASTQPETPLNRIRSRRKLKSSLFFALTMSALLVFFRLPTATHAFSTGNRSGLSQRRSEWIERSVQYYSTVMRKNTGSAQLSPHHKTQIDSTPSIPEVLLRTNNRNAIVADVRHDKDFVGLATKHYYARFLIKEGKWEFAEKIYRRIISDITSEGDDCDHTKLAVSTLLLALHLQRTGDVKATRTVFLEFFRRVALAKEEEEGLHKCSCSAKVLQAYALFEMKNGHSAKSLEIIRRAVTMDEKLRPVLEWKQFRDAAAGREYVPTFSFRKRRQKSKGGTVSP